MRFIPGDADKTISDAQARIIGYVDHYNQHGYSKNILRPKRTRKAIGDSGIFQLDNTEEVEIGYRVKYKYWGLGYATEAATAIINDAFERFDFKSVYAVTELKHIVSQYIIERLGFTKIGAENYYGEAMWSYRLGGKKIL